MGILTIIAMSIQGLAGLGLIFLMAVQTTKSEQSGSGMGWGTIGGQASSSVKKFGLDAKISQVTMVFAVIFILSSVIAAVLHKNNL
ncbi:MAG: preprotein translocase subunit SecG [bacterium]